MLNALSVVEHLAAVSLIVSAKTVRVLSVLPAGEIPILKDMAIVCNLMKDVLLLTATQRADRTTGALRLHRAEMCRHLLIVRARVEELRAAMVI